MNNMGDSNESKSRHGANAICSLGEILETCKSNSYVNDITEKYRVGYENYSDAQFYAPFLLHFDDETKWILYSTTSMRTDRIKGQQWDAINLKKIDPAIQYAFITYPDGSDINVAEEFIRQREKYLRELEYSAIDDILSHNELFKRIEEKALSAFGSGKRKDREGRSFEYQFATIMANQRNYVRWKTGDADIVGVHYDLYEKILNFLKLDSANIIAISATDNIKSLPSGGPAKTDVCISVAHPDDFQEQYTFSCKRSSSDKVSVHQYKADDFADTLAPENKELRRLLNLFQSNPSLTAFGKKNCVLLTKALEPYKKELAMWVLGGYGGKGTATQWAEYIIVYKNDINQISVHSVDDYYDELLKNNAGGHFGTVFSWTYPSKQREKSIQLKCKIL